jgi:hypothetical protein
MTRMSKSGLVRRRYPLESLRREVAALRQAIERLAPQGSDYAIGKP